MRTYKLIERFGSFAEDKKEAKKLRIEELLPQLKIGNEIELDFLGVEDATQSFIHALISDLIRVEGIEIMDNISFKNCNTKIENIICIVFEYMQDSLGDDE